MAPHRECFSANLAARCSHVMPSGQRDVNETDVCTVHISSLCIPRQAPCPTWTSTFSRFLLGSTMDRPKLSFDYTDEDNILVGGGWNPRELKPGHFGTITRERNKLSSL